MLSQKGVLYGMGWIWFSLMIATGGLSCSFRTPDYYVHIRGTPLQQYNACLEKNRGEPKETLEQRCRPYLEQKWEWVQKE